MRRKAGVKVSSGGFTLIELMVVVAIVATLASVAMPAYFNYLMRSRQTAVIADLMSIKAAEERFFAEKGGYAAKMNKPDFMYATSGTFSNGYYRYYFVTAGTSVMVNTGIIRAEGDLNGDGNFTDVWEVSIDKLSEKPKQTASGEGFGWSNLGHLFN